MPGEKSTDPTTMGGGLLNNPLLQIGMGILANNTGHYGAFGPAVGQGMQQGMQNIRQSQQDAQNAQLYKMKIDEYKKQQKQQDDLANYMKLNPYGDPNSTSDPTTTTTNLQAPIVAGQPQGNLTPQFNTVPQTTTTAGTPKFDAAKWQSGLMPLLPPEDALKLIMEKHKNTYVDTGNGLMQLDENGSPTGLVMPKGVSPDSQLSAGVSMTNHATPSGDTLYNNTHVSANTVANNKTSMRNTDVTQTGETSRAADKKTNDPTNTDSLFKKPQTTNAPKVASLKDVQDTAKASGKTTAQVTKDLKAQGYTIGGM